MVRFDPAKVKVTEGQLRIARPSYQRSRFAEMWYDQFEGELSAHAENSDIWNRQAQNSQ